MLDDLVVILLGKIEHLTIIFNGGGIAARRGTGRRRSGNRLNRENTCRTDDNVVDFEIVGREIVIHVCAVQGELIQRLSNSQFALIAQPQHFPLFN